MSDLFGPVAAAVALFVGTDVDDVVVLTLLFLSARTSGRPRRWQIWIGQYTGIAVLVAVSAAAAAGLAVVPDHWAGLLGVIPIALGVRGLVEAFRQEDDDPPTPVATGVLSVATVTVANGGDNVAVYTPAFRALGPAATLVAVVVFTLGVALWCLLADWLASHRPVLDLVERYGRWLVPVIFLLLGLVILTTSGLPAHLLG